VSSAEVSSGFPAQSSSNSAASSSWITGPVGERVFWN
jgi:hypothetical protein